MPPTPPSLGLGLGVPFVRPPGPSSGPSLDPDLDPDVLVFNGAAIWYNGVPMLFTNESYEAPEEVETIEPYAAPDADEFYAPPGETIEIYAAPTG